MPRRLKFREPTDVISVRLPLSLIDRLDELCQSLRVGRAEFIVALLRKYPEVPSPERARIWLANLVWIFVGGGTALLLAAHGGGTRTADDLSPVRGVTRAPLQLESDAPGQPGVPVAPPAFPPRDLRLDSGWRLGTLQALIPREPQPGPAPAPTRDPARGQTGNPPSSGSRP